eukprot:CAMPEP_0176251970 /NCGR_PEP_ID=MMETSP0121_2-20121125/35270_1 /TAXON_ID=160619 /ORGANISM="Kryptoperidinium foliaceum, Strain CCMP 1326" /LENGTH=200 /DNA_ID=CAMNT_0017591723 /DNA_START=91 /DNA_END=694 /DNA_ORIENTATION=-
MWPEDLSPPHSAAHAAIDDVPVLHLVDVSRRIVVAESELPELVLRRWLHQAGSTLRGAADPTDLACLQVSDVQPSPGLAEDLAQAPRRDLVHAVAGHVLVASHLGAVLGRDHGADGEDLEAQVGLGPAALGGIRGGWDPAGEADDPSSGAGSALGCDRCRDVDAVERGGGGPGSGGSIASPMPGRSGATARASAAAAAGT